MLRLRGRCMDVTTIALVLLGSGFIGFLFAPLGLGGGLLLHHCFTMAWVGTLTVRYSSFR